MCGTSDRPSRNIVLVGFMGSGKTSVGAELARRLGWELVDTDEIVEARTGRTIVEIFAQEGEAVFRDLESEAVADAASRSDVIIATGGGAVIRPENVTTLRRTGVLVLLDATAEDIYERVVKGDHPRRPLLHVPDPMERIRELLDERRPSYARADFRIPTTGREVEEIVEEVLKQYHQKDIRRAPR